MIFLTVGNWHKGFDRLVEAVDKLKTDRIINEDIVAQIGQGNYKPRALNYIDYCSPEDFSQYLLKSDVVVSHAGIGTILQAIAVCKPLVVVPRKSTLGECMDGHQIVTAEAFEKEGKILVAYEVEHLPEKLKQAKTFVPSKEQNGQMIVQVVEEFLENLANKKAKTKK